MKLLKSADALSSLVLQSRQKGLSVGFVPTMGALHQGHISLIEKSRADNNISICSIYVNPTQFNNAEDFKKYPKTIENDINLLEKWGCDVLFLPETDEVYSKEFVINHYNLGYLESLLEGKYRPGHFQGVCQVVHRLLQIVMPDKLYLGRKDYQQCMVISKMIELKEINTEVVICPTLREPDGLAMSSRNLRLNETQRITAVQIFKTMQMIRKEITPGNLYQLKQKAVKILTDAGFRVDYVEIADAGSLEPIIEWNGQQKAVTLVAAFLDDIRLIDNLAIT